MKDFIRHGVAWPCQRGDTSRMTAGVYRSVGRRYVRQAMALEARMLTLGTARACHPPILMPVCNVRTVFFWPRLF